MADSDTLESRARQADRIVRAPEKYKVCCGCESIVFVKTAICPNCHGYRFDFDAQLVVTQAQILGQRPRQSVLVSDLQ
jgi:hypothetical protein